MNKILNQASPNLTTVIAITALFVVCFSGIIPSSSKTSEPTEYEHKVVYSATTISGTSVHKETAWWESQLEGELKGWEYVGVLNSTNPAVKFHPDDRSYTYYDTTVTYTLWRRAKSKK